MKILVYGAGNIGQVYAALLHESGQEVSILARGERLAEIRSHGIRLEDADSGSRTISMVNAVESLEIDDAYDLVLVVLPKNHVSEVLPMLARNCATPGVMFFGNNAAGPGEMIDSLGMDRVLLGFPGAAAVVRDSILRFIISDRNDQPTTIGELDGSKSDRLREIAEVFEAAGFPTSICSNMDAWLKTHVAEISPTADALYMAGVDARRLANTRDALVLMLRAIREGYKVLAADDVPITPRHHRIFEWLPEPLLVSLMQKKLKSKEAEIKIGHALAARGEMKTIADEFRGLISSSHLQTPAMDRLYRYLDPTVEPVAEGAAEIALDWTGTVALAVAVTLFIGGTWMIWFGGG